MQKVPEFRPLEHMSLLKKKNNELISRESCKTENNRNLCSIHPRVRVHKNQIGILLLDWNKRQRKHQNAPTCQVSNEQRKLVFLLFRIKQKLQNTVSLPSVIRMKRTKEIFE